MKAVGNYNKISQELQKLIPKIPHGKEVAFQMLNGVKNNDPDKIEASKNPMFFPKQNIPMKDRIWDEYAKNEEGETVGQWVDIVVADGWDKGEPTRLHFFQPYDAGAHFNGKFSLYGGNSKSEEIYEFLMLCNLNREAVTGKYRNTAVHPLFAPINAIKESNSVRTKVEELRKALDLTKDMKADDARSFANAMNWNEYSDDAVLLAKVEDFAREKPDEFLKVYNDPTKEFKALLKESLNLQVASFDMQSGQFKVGDALITTLPKEDRVNMLDSMGVWFQNNKNGEEVLKSIKKQIKNKKQPEMA